MKESKGYVIGGMIFLSCLVIFCIGWIARSPLLAGGFGVGLCYVMLRISCFGREPGNKGRDPQLAKAAPLRATPPKPVDPNDINGLVEQMLAQERFALLLRPQVVGNLSEDQFRRTLCSLEQTMALVPDGGVVLVRTDEALDDGKLDDEEIAAARGHVIKVERFFLDRYPVTNRQFYQFAASGGYAQMSLWDKSIWTAVLDLVDCTGMPGPRYWQHGHFLPGEENHPVVGVSWYEACAYARWLGKRLPTDPEWVKAGSWPVPLCSTVRMQRKYPWGDTMDLKCANLWGSGPGRIVAVDQFPGGVSVGGVYQLIGNVWEWAGGNFRAGDHPSGELILPVPMKSIRGGAFDTYFDNQATCQFQSGENPLQRRHNIGFRCAVGVCDLVLGRSAPAPRQTPVEQQGPETEESHA